MMGAHALLAPSSAKRWMACPPSARLEANMPEKETAYSREGSIAHGMAEFILGHFTVHCYTCMPELGPLVRDMKSEEPVNILARGLRHHVALAEAEGLDGYEMLETVYEHYCRPVYETYLGAQLQDPEAVLLIEARLKLTEFIPEGFGSSDAVLIYGDTLEVFDLKYGKGVKVEAKENPQMMCYAIGAWAGPGETYHIQKVRMTIIQPRLRHESTWELDATDLLDWAQHDLAPAAIAAYNGQGELCAGDHCRFCKCAAQCRKLADFTVSVVSDRTSPELLTIEEIARMLPQFATIKSWMASVEEHALQSALDGIPVPGFKIVAGRSVRKIGDPAAAVERLAEGGWEPQDYFKPQELKTITDLEKTLTKKGFKTLLGDLVIKPEGKPTLVEESDPREPYSKANSDFAAILDTL